MIVELFCCRGDPFISFIDNLPSLNRKMDGPFLMPVLEKYKDMGTVVMGKVESGEMKKGQSLILMPNRVSPLPAEFTILNNYFTGCPYISTDNFTKLYYRSNQTIFII